MVHGSKAFLCKPTFRVTPKVGDFYFFPHYLMHAVYPFLIVMRKEDQFHLMLL